MKTKDRFWRLEECQPYEGLAVFSYIDLLGRIVFFNVTKGTSQNIYIPIDFLLHLSKKEIEEISQAARESFVKRKQ